MIETAGCEAGRSRKSLLTVCLLAAAAATQAQAPQPTAQAADPPEKLPPLGLRAVYHNPILFADYSDPDVIRDGLNYYLVASTFHFVPGIPILQSGDLVHWTIIGHVVERLNMDSALQPGRRQSLRQRRVGAVHQKTRWHLLRLLPYSERGHLRLDGKKDHRTVERTRGRNCAGGT